MHLSSGLDLGVLFTDMDGYHWSPQMVGGYHGIMQSRQEYVASISKVVLVVAICCDFLPDPVISHYYTFS